MKDMPLEIEQEIQKLNEKKKEASTTLPPITMDEVATLLINKGNEARSEKEEIKNNGEIKQHRLTPVEVANIMKQILPFAMFDLNEGSRVAMYVIGEGIYTQNTTFIKRYIAKVENTFSDRQADQVLTHLRNESPVKKKTRSRYLIPVKNGVFNIKTKKLEVFNPDYVFTSKIDTPYYPGLESPIIEGWNINEWMKDLANNDEEVERLLWQVISACLNGNYSRKKSIWLYSEEGSTGKGTFQQLIMNIVGSKNVATLKLPQFQERFSLSMLEEKVCCIGDDVPTSVYVDDASNFQSVVTGDPIMIEQKYQPAYIGQFNLTIVQSTNGLPQFRKFTTGTKRRFLIIPFTKVFTGENDNWKIKNEYIDHDQVKQYVLKRAIELDFESFIEPSISKNLLKQFEFDNNHIADFKENVFDTWEVNRIPSITLYKAYENFCNDNGFKLPNQNTFTKEFRRLLGKNWKSSVAFRLDDQTYDKLNDVFKEEYLNPIVEKDKVYKGFKYEPFKVIENVTFEF